jgi:hypothetical protein
LAGDVGRAVVEVNDRRVSDIEVPLIATDVSGPPRPVVTGAM